MSVDAALFPTTSHLITELLVFMSITKMKIKIFKMSKGQRVASLSIKYSMKVFKSSSVLNVYFFLP